MAEFSDTARLLKEIALQKTIEANLIQSGTGKPIDAMPPPAKKRKIGEVDVDDFLESDGYDGDAEMEPEQEGDELLDELLSSYGEEDDVSEDVGVKLVSLVKRCSRIHCLWTRVRKSRSSISAPGIVIRCKHLK